MDPFEEARAVEATIEADGATWKGKINVYACTPPLTPNSLMKAGCGYWIVTVDRDAGVTPMFTRCGNCGGTASSRMYHVGEGLEPTHEWFRPKSAAELPEGYSLASVADHLAHGGLLLRPIGDGRWLEPTPATRALIAKERQALAEMMSSAPSTRQQRRYQERKH